MSCDVIESCESIGFKAKFKYILDVCKSSRNCLMDPD